MVDENVIQTIPGITLAGVSEHSTQFRYDLGEFEIRIIGTAQLSTPQQCSVLSIEDMGRQNMLQLGIGYDFVSKSVTTGAMSLRSIFNGIESVAPLYAGADLAVGVEFCVQIDPDAGFAYLYSREPGSAPWVYRSAVSFSPFRCHYLRRYNRRGRLSPINQSSTWGDITVHLPSIVSIGDSITAGKPGFDPRKPSTFSDGTHCWQAHCWPFPGLKNSVISNKGVPGESTQQVNARIQQANRHGARLILLSVQNNDYADGLTLDQRTSQIHGNLQSCLASGANVVLIGAIYENNNAPSAAYYRAWRDAWLPLLSGQLGYVEITDAVAGASGNIYDQYTADGLHPNKAGYTLIGQYIAQQVEALYVGTN